MKMQDEIAAVENRKLDSLCRIVFDEQIFDRSTINREMAKYDKYELKTGTKTDEIKLETCIKRNDLDVKQLHEEVEIENESAASLEHIGYRVINSTAEKEAQAPNYAGSENAVNASMDDDTCMYCNAVFKSERALYDHILKQHPEHSALVTSEVYECKMCHYKTTFRHLIERHVLKHREAERKTCIHCNKAFKSKTTMGQHILRKHPEFAAEVTSKIHKCKMCSYQTTVKYFMDRHMLNHPEARSCYKFKTCIHCNGEFKSKIMMDEHILKKHPEFVAEVTSKIHACEICIFKTAFKSLMDTHVLKEHPELIESVTSKIYECKVCFRKTTSKSFFAKHMLGHPEVEPSYDYELSSCIHCNQEFKTKRLMDEHILRNHPEFVAEVTSKIHACKICIYKTTYTSLMDKHISMNHPESKSNFKYKICIYCNQKFKAKEMMEDHILRKHPEFGPSVTSKLHECKICMYKTTLKRSIDRHMRKHSKGNT